MDYKDSGVDLDVAHGIVEQIGQRAKETFRAGVMGEIGGFGALFSLSKDSYKNPVLVSSTDGVGTKLKVAFMMGIHDTVGIDLVAMCVNDIVAQGAEPLFFLDYLAMGKLDANIASAILDGIVAGCKEAGCALIGGETAELPDMYRPGEYELAGFCVGIAERDEIVDGSDISVGDTIVGIASSGLHSNGYSLVRNLFFKRLKWKADKVIPDLGKTLGEELLLATRIYVRPILNIIRDFRVKGVAHITGGGLTGNLPRILPKSCQAIIHKKSWPRQPIFDLIQKKGNVSEEEMYRVFNNGIGMAVVVPSNEAQEVIHRLEAMDETAYIIGEIREKPPEGTSILYV